MFILSPLLLLSLFSDFCYYSPRSISQLISLISSEIATTFRPISSKQGSGHASLSIQKPSVEETHGFNSYHHKSSCLPSLPGAGRWELDYGGCQPARWTGKPALLTCHACPLQLPQTYAEAGHHWPGVARIPLLPSFSLLIIPAIPTAWTGSGDLMLHVLSPEKPLPGPRVGDRQEGQTWAQVSPEGLKARTCGRPSTAWLLLNGLCNAACPCTQPGISCLCRVGCREQGEHLWGCHCPRTLRNQRSLAKGLAEGAAFWRR